MDDVEILKEIEGALSHTRIWKVKILISKTRVPILRVVFKPLDLGCKFKILQLITHYLIASFLKQWTL